MASALELVKSQFGRDAVILSTRTSGRGGLLGFGGKTFVEITAAKAWSDLPASPKVPRIKRTSARMEHADGAADRMAPTARMTSSNPAALVAEIGSLRSVVTDLVRETRRARAGTVPEQLHEAYLHLVQNEVAEEVAQQLVEQVRAALSDKQLGDAQAVRAELVRSLEAMLPSAGPIQLVQAGGPTVIALVGPTGVGKTTTVAKLAANFRLRQKRKVGLVTIDTYRIGAVEQLRTYAEIIDVPLVVVTTPRELAEAVVEMRDVELILIDTAGRSPRDAVKINELAGFFRETKPHEVHLVLSGTSGKGVLQEATDRFAPLEIDRVILTKLDEAVGLGVVLSCLDKIEARLSYVTTGQDVPDDIAEGKGRVLAELILGDYETRV